MRAGRKHNHILFWDNVVPCAKNARLKNIHSSDHKSLCELMRRLREEKGVTQHSLAQKLDVPQSFVSKVETGERRLDVLELRSICLALEIPLRRFVQLLEEDLG